MRKKLTLIVALLGMHTIASAKFNPDKIDCKHAIRKFSKITASQYALSLRLSDEQKTTFSKAITETLKDCQVNNEQIRIAGKKVSLLNEAMAQNELDNKLKNILTYSQYEAYQSLHRGVEMYVDAFGLQFRI